MHVLQCLAGWPLPARSRKPLEAFVRESFESPVKFVRAWAYSGLHALAEEFEDLRPEAMEALEGALEDGPASVKARVRKLLAQGFSDGP